MTDRDVLSALEWAVSGAIAILMALVSHIHWRLNRQEARTANELDKVWQAIDGLRDRMMDMPSKTDLRDMEARVMAAIRGRPQ